MSERPREEISPEDVELIYRYSLSDASKQVGDVQDFLRRFPQVEGAPEIPLEEFGFTEEDLDKLYRGDWEMSLREKYAKGVLEIYSKLLVPKNELIDFIKSRIEND